MGWHELFPFFLKVLVNICCSVEHRPQKDTATIRNTFIFTLVLWTELFCLINGPVSGQTLWIVQNRFLKLAVVRYFQVKLNTGTFPQCLLLLMYVLLCFVYDSYCKMKLFFLCWMLNVKGTVQYFVHVDLCKYRNSIRFALVYFYGWYFKKYRTTMMILELWCVLLLQVMHRYLQHLFEDAELDIELGGFYPDCFFVLENTGPFL